MYFLAFLLLKAAFSVDGSVGTFFSIHSWKMLREVVLSLSQVAMGLKVENSWIRLFQLKAK